VDHEEDDGPSNGGLTTADLNNILSCGSGESSLLSSSSSPETELMHHQHQHQPQQPQPPPPPALIVG